jgi:anti-anti-sigma regulatory factor
MSGMSVGSLSGAITFENFAAMRKAGEMLIEQSDILAREGSGDGRGVVVSIDVGGIDTANSLAVGAMVAWFRYGQRRQARVQFHNVSDSLRKIIRVSGLTDILLGEK